MCTTYSGRLITPLNYGIPAPIDMAVQLGRLPRWSGGTREWWSVLHHIRLCVAIEEQLNLAPLTWSAATHDYLRGLLLLHEADEVVTGDIPTTWKHPEQRAMVKPLQRRVLDLYLRDLHAGEGAEEAEGLLKHIDLLALRAEAEVLAPPGALVNTGLADVCEFSDADISDAVELVVTLQAAYASPLDSAVYGSPLGAWFLREVAALCGTRLMEQFGPYYDTSQKGRAG